MASMAPDSSEFNPNEQTQRNMQSQIQSHNRQNKRPERPQPPRPMKKITSHFKRMDENSPKHSVEEELLEVFDKDEVRTMTLLPKPFIDHLSQFYPLVRNEADIRALPDKFPKHNELGFCPMFSSNFIDVTAQVGMFPMAIDVGGDHFVFSPKCHVSRCITRIFPLSQKEAEKYYATYYENKQQSEKDSNCNERPEVSDVTGFPCCFDYSKIMISSKLQKKCIVRAHFNVPVTSGNNSTPASDLRGAMSMIYSQHGENWLCSQMRSCVQYMMQRPEEFRTNFIVLNVIEKSTGDIIACETGYIVGDIYTSFTGAYNVSGAGSLSLAATAKMLQLLGISVWDLGMVLPYKVEALSASEMKRSKWLSFVKERITAEEKVHQQNNENNVDGKGKDKTDHTSANGKEATVLVPKTFLWRPHSAQVMAVLSQGVEATALLSASSLQGMMNSSSPN
eukprot:Tbor_TRINITY_DN4358_c0_g1::TRINITY_DN4358_c0_g1_i1::g.7857::m.7857